MGTMKFNSYVVNLRSTLDAEGSPKVSSSRILTELQCLLLLSTRRS
jgi:hypothetical protein